MCQLHLGSENMILEDSEWQQPLTPLPSVFFESSWNRSICILLCLVMGCSKLLHLFLFLCQTCFKCLHVIVSVVVQWVKPLLGTSISYIGVLVGVQATMDF